MEVQPLGAQGSPHQARSRTQGRQVGSVRGRQKRLRREGDSQQGWLRQGHQEVARRHSSGTLCKVESKILIKITNPKVKKILRTSWVVLKTIQIVVVTVSFII